MAKASCRPTVSWITSTIGSKSKPKALEGRPGTGKARVRFVNLNIDNAAVDVLSNFTKSVGNLAYLGASPYQDLDAGTYTFAFNTSNANVVVATTDTLTLETGKVYTLFLFGTGTAADTRLVTDS